MKRGQIFVSLIVFFLALLIMIFAAPIISTIINESLSGLGSATKFVVKSFLWVVLLVFVAVFFRIISSGEGFLA